jgi:hypothetical protein
MVLAVVTCKPWRDKVKTWPIPVEQQEAVKQMLAQRVPARAAEG